jgi:hypothetical protein
MSRFKLALKELRETKWFKRIVSLGLWLFLLKGIIWIGVGLYLWLVAN